VRAQAAQVLELPTPAARVSNLVLSGMPHDAAHSSLPAEPNAEPIVVESRAPAFRRSMPATASRSLRHASDAASSSSTTSCVTTATSSSAGRSSSRQSN
jgi:hypothetical protein